MNFLAARNKTISVAWKYISKALKYILVPLKYISKPLKKFLSPGRRKCRNGETNLSLRGKKLHIFYFNIGRFCF